MKLRSLVTGLVLLTIIWTASAQLIQNEDGLYYNEKGELYSGSYIEFYSNGNKRIELNILNGQKDGEVHIYFENGMQNEIRSFKHGQMDGTWITWNEQGVKIGLANYRDNLKHGEWLIWDDNGVLRFEMNYDSGKKSGIWRMYNPEGNLVAEDDKTPAPSR